jgi:hypothetical protein
LCPFSTTNPSIVHDPPTPSLRNAGTLPAGLLASPVLQELALSNVRLPADTPLPPEWAASQSLRTLQLVNMSGVGGGVPAAWATGLPALGTLVLDGVSGLPTSLADYVPLLTGPLRTAPSPNASGLVSVTLSNLGLAGGVPDALLNHHTLMSLSLARNALSGPLGGAAWVTANSTAALRSLDLSGNAFSGALPPEWSALSLYSLNLSRNNLTGARRFFWRGCRGALHAGARAFSQRCRTAGSC